jgi:CHAT domain-containing protein
MGPLQIIRHLGIAVLSGFAMEAYRTYRRTGARRHIDRAVWIARIAVNLTHTDDQKWAGLMDTLGVMLEAQYGPTGEIAGLEEAIVISRQAVAATPNNHPDRAGRLGNLGNKLQRRYERTGNIADLEEAIAISRQAVATMPDNHPDRAGQLGNLGSKLGRRYEQTGEIADLEEAIILSRQAVAATPDDHPDRAGWLSNVGGRLIRRYEQTGEIADLEEAIAVSRRAVAATPNNYPDRVICLNNLGIKLQRRYEQTGKIADLEEAIAVSRQAIVATPDDHPDRAGWLSNLGTKLICRFERIGEIADIEEAITMSRQAVADTPDRHPGRVNRLNKLGNELECRYDRTGETADLEEAITISRQATAAVSDNHPARLGIWNDLGSKLGRRYERTGKITDLEEAIAISRKAVASIPNNHPARAGCWNTLGILLGRQYRQTGEITDLDEAIAVSRLAAAAIPDSHPDRAIFLNNLGNKLFCRYKRIGATSDLDDASNFSQEAWHLTSAIPFHRIQAAAQSIELLAIQRKIGPAAQLGKDVIDLLPAVSAKHLSRKDRQYAVSAFGGLAASLCSLLLASNQLDDALRYLEAGRATILSQLIDNRSDPSILARDHPDLACQYEKIRLEINNPIRDQEQDIAREQVLNHRRQIISDYEACIRQIRTMPGHERFLLSQTITEMRRCAVGGSIVVVNISAFRSDAIIITPTVTKALQITKLSVSDAKIWLGKNWRGRAKRATNNKEYAEYLGWLWESCVEQILDEVRALQNAPEDELLRVWWIGSGHANSMPFHAAGVHRKGSTKTAYHRAVSSYVPSIKALAHSRERANTSKTTLGPLLLVSMPTTPAENDRKQPPSLPEVTREKDIVLSATQGRLQGQHMERPSVNEVLKRLQACSIAHFACHGLSDHRDPSKSGLILQRPREIQGAAGRKEGHLEVRPVQDRLTVGRISETSLRHPRLAYLSACSTAQNKAERLSDEVIHVVSGFLVAGFPHVVGCLWPSIDRVCLEVASGFYSRLFQQGESQWKDKQVARALRDALMEVRESDIEMPLNWAQYVHYGA